MVDEECTCPLLRDVLQGQSVASAVLCARHPGPLDKSEPWRPPQYVVEDRGHDTPCWIWIGTIDQKGYGRFRGAGVSSTLAHRQVYERERGPVPDGLDLDHLCRVHACVNPDHLEPVTRSENCRRGIGTKLTADDVLAIRASDEDAHALAERYGITTRYVGMLRRRVKWADI